MDIQPTFILEDLRVSFTKILDRTFYGQRIVFHYKSRMLDPKKSLEDQDPAIELTEKPIEIKVKLESMGA